MAELTRASGVTISITGPAELNRGEPPPKRGAKATKRRVSDAPGDGGLLLDVLAEQDFELVDSIPLTIPSAARPKKRGGAAPSSSVVLDVPLRADEQAVILLEDEGEYRWIVEGQQLPTPGPKRGRQRPMGQKRFTLDIKAAPPPPTLVRKRGGVKRNWLLDKAIGKVTAFVFRFSLKLAGTKVVEFLERKVEQGLVALTTPDPQRWQRLTDKAPLPFELPGERAPRVLLFVHGTFSSTIGSFGALGVVSRGRDFLSRALTHYDAVLGYDHATLSVDPLENAKIILARLRKVKWREPPQIDVIAYSRGGLVARSIIEQLLPGSGWGATVGKVVFVGCTNGGTQLAEPDNWQRFADHYTNLALGATRLLGLIPGARGVSSIASGVIRGVGVLIKSLAVGAITDQLVPGLAAMEPDGKFVTTINQAQPGQASALDARYFAVTSNFEAGKALSGGGTPELPPKLLMRVADWGADELYREANDLVVHVRSMTQINLGLGDLVKGKLDYGTNGVVYHTNYFTRDTTAAKLIEWLELPGAAPTKRAVKRKGRPPAKKPAVGKATSMARKRTPGGPAKRATRKRAAKKSGIKKAKKSGAKKAPARAAARSLRQPRPAAHSGGPPNVGAQTSVHAALKRSFRKTAKRLVRQGRNPMTGEALRAPRQPANAPPRRSTRKPSKAARAKPQSVGRGRSETLPSRIECHFRAEMDAEVAVNKTVSVDVTIARHALEVAAGRTGETATGQVDEAKKLIVQIAERRNFRVDGERRVEIDVPAPDDEANLSFDVTGLIAGEEGELWVQVRQGPVPLATLKLKPRIVTTTRPAAIARLPVTSELTRLPPAEPPLDELLIQESFVGTAVQYRYFLDLPSLHLRKHFESPVLQGRDAYITKILNRIGDAWAGSGKDQLEAFETDLKSLGAMMFTELMPREMQELLWEQRGHITSVQVFSMEPFIPWELVYLKDPRHAVISDDSKFLGELGLVRWLYDGYPPTQLVIGSKRARYIIPTYRGDMALPDAAGEAQMMKKLFKATAVKARALDVQKLLRTPGSFDLLHFGGHAEAAGEEQADARLLLDQLDDGTSENALLATTVAQTAQLEVDGHRPIVVLNACESARMSRSFASMGGFASAFVSRGAGVFIGTHWSVGDAPARTFIEAFYKAFAKPAAGAKPLQLREAVSKARQAARAGGDATWLAYVVYGHPYAIAKAKA